MVKDGDEISFQGIKNKNVRFTMPTSALCYWVVDEKLTSDYREQEAQAALAELEKHEQDAQDQLLPKKKSTKKH